MRLSEVAPLLHPAPLKLEMGYERLDDGVLHVAVRTDMHKCSGESFEWWFRFQPDTQKYIWWHPVDHISSHWIETEQGTHVNSIHVVEEAFTGQPSEKLLIQFREPTEFFEKADYESARMEGRISAAICGRVGFGHDAKRDEQGKILGGRLLHIGRDTPWGLALRSHFYIGEDLPGLGLSPSEVEQMAPDSFGEALLQHCYNEFTFLSRFLPSLFIAEHRDTRQIEVPW